MKKIRTILIANRGEIACRIIKTAKKMNIKTICVYSDIDKNSLFISQADFAISLGGKTAKESYLNMEKIIKIAKEYNVDAIHPGYGFLSENADFAKKLEDQKIGFIGPSSFSIDAIGDKLKAKNIAKKANVQSVPSYNELIENENHATEICKKIGLPVMIKAVAGGGGKGMRVVYNEKDVTEAFNSAKSEAKNAYGNDQIFIEKFIVEPHHIEIQIIADKFGNIVCLGERECSIQRFNQKVIEETPSVFVDPELRKKMFEASIALAKACNYHSVGTMEFVVDQEKNFYFLEMNTRLQVEHSVTEYTTGLDLVELMIKIEEGEKLPFSQNQIEFSGHSIECRICAENPSKNFLPSIGKISHYIEPQKSHNVRIDSGIIPGDEISPYYDAMIAKLITHGDTRHEAIETMKKALSYYEIEGINSNIEFLEALMRNEQFIKGNLSTSFIKKHYPNGFNYLELNDNSKKSFIISAIIIFLESQKRNFSSISTSSLPRNVFYHRLHVQIKDETYLIAISSYEENFVEIIYQDQKIVMKYLYKYGEKSIRGIMDNKFDINIKLKYLDDGYLMSASGSKEIVYIRQSHIYEYAKYIKYEKFGSRPQFLLSPLAGRISKIKAKNGDKIHQNDHILSIEAMKMDNCIFAEHDCKIKSILINENSIISSGDRILEFEYEN